MNIPSGLEKKFGIEHRYLIDSLEIYNSMEIYMLNTKDSSMVLSSKKLFPILSQNKIICFARGIEEEGEIKLFGLGGNLLAGKIEKVKKKSKNEEIALIALPEQNTYLLIDNINIKDKQKMTFFSIENIDECGSCSFAKIDTYTFEELITMIKVLNSKTKPQDENFTN